MAIPKKNQIHRKEVDHEVRIGLDPKERDPIVKELTTALKDADELRAEAKEVQSGYRRKQKELKEKIDELALTLSQGRPETISCEQIKDFGKRTVTYKRLDTGAVVEKRPMTEDDDQMDLGENADEGEAAHE